MAGCSPGFGDEFHEIVFREFLVGVFGGFGGVEDEEIE